MENNKETIIFNNILLNINKIKIIYKNVIPTFKKNSVYLYLKHTEVSNNDDVILAKYLTILFCMI